MAIIFTAKVVGCLWMAYAVPRPTIVLTTALITVLKGSTWVLPAKRAKTLEIVQHAITPNGDPVVSADVGRMVAVWRLVDMVGTTIEISSFS